MNKYVKVEGHNNWFLVIDSNNEKIQNDFSELMQERLLRTVYNLHSRKSDDLNWQTKLKISATNKIDYNKLYDKIGTLLVRPIGSYMPLKGNKVIDEKYDLDFPIDDFAEIVICENDQYPDTEWVDYLKNRFNGKTIKTINFFDLTDEYTVKKNFDKAKYVTFSTTFTNLEWFKKLVKCLNDNNNVIGFCHNSDKWDDALKIFNKIEIVNNIYEF